MAGVSCLFMYSRKTKQKKNRFKEKFIIKEQEDITFVHIEKTTKKKKTRKSMLKMEIHLPIIYISKTEAFISTTQQQTAAAAAAASSSM